MNYGSKGFSPGCIYTTAYMNKEAKARSLEVIQENQEQMKAAFLEQELRRKELKNKTVSTR